jgi:hypothetical protein
VSSERRRVTTVFITTTLALVVVLGLRPVSVERILAGYVLALAAIALASLTRVLAATVDGRASSFEHAIALKRSAPPRPSELIRVEREITLGTTNAGHLHSRLVPLLREAAAARLGFDLDLRPAAARERLGDETWELLRPDREPPSDRNAPGLPLRRVRAVVDALERL